MEIFCLYFLDGFPNSSFASLAAIHFFTWRGERVSDNFPVVYFTWQC